MVSYCSTIKSNYLNVALTATSLPCGTIQSPTVPPKYIIAERYGQTSNSKKKNVYYITLIQRQQVQPPIGQFGHNLLIFLGLVELSAASKGGIVPHCRLVAYKSYI